MRASTIVDAHSGVSWAAVTAGAVGAAALALLLIAFGAGLGLSAISPWSDSGVSASTFKTGTGIYLVIVAVMSSAVGGYLAARLRTKWVRVHTHEVFFRDTAHGFLAWAFATLLSATALSSATAYFANGTAAAVGGAALQATGSVNPTDIYVDKLFRTSPAAQPAPASSPNSATPNNPNPNRIGHGENSSLCLADVKEGVTAAAPTASKVEMPRDNAIRVVTGARALSPNLGQRMMSAKLLGKSVVVRELMPQDLKIEVNRLSREEAMNLARYGVVARAHGRQMKTSQRRACRSDLAKNHKASLETPSWLWTSVVELLGLHEAAYLDHCRRFALSEAA
jgi:hypothetical protein